MIYKLLTISLMITAALSLYLQIAATFLVAQSSERLVSKITQYFVIWGIPVIGAIFISYFRLEEYHNRTSSISRLYSPLLLITGNNSQNYFINQSSNSAHDNSDDIWAED